MLTKSVLIKKIRKLFKICWQVPINILSELLSGEKEKRKNTDTEKILLFSECEAM